MLADPANIISLRDTLRECRRAGQTVLSVNIFDYMSFRALATAFADAGHPVMAQCSSRLFKQYAPREIVAWRQALSLGGVWVHLDHCNDLNLFQACATAGFDSVMFDGSALPLVENIKRSREAVQIAKAMSPTVMVECEIGHVQGVEDGFGGATASSSHLSVNDVMAFQEAVRPDTLAVGFGNMHGFYRGDEVFDLELISAVSSALPEVPLVLHGGSGMALPLVRQLVGWGHVKLNISTDLKHFWMGLLKSSADNIPQGLDSPLAVTQHWQGQLGRYFTQLMERYLSCLR